MYQKLTQILDIVNLNLWYMSWKERTINFEQFYTETVNYLSRQSKYQGWPKRFSFEDNKWKAEFLYLCYDVMTNMCAEDNSSQAKYLTMQTFQSYVRNIETQVNKFSIDSKQIYDEDEIDSKQAPRYERNSQFYASVNLPYPEHEVKSLPDQDDSASKQRASGEEDRL